VSGKQPGWCLLRSKDEAPSDRVILSVSTRCPLDPFCRRARTSAVKARRLRFFSSRTDRRRSNWASTIQYSATFSYALLKNGSLACAARCLASSALRRQVSLSDDICGGASNAPEPSGKCGVGQLVTTLPLPVRRWPLVSSLERWLGLALRAASLMRRRHPTLAYEPLRYS
jgi:hypothetical protein